MDDGARAGKLVVERLREMLEDARKSAGSRPQRTDEELAAGFGIDNPIDEWNPNEDGLRKRI